MRILSVLLLIGMIAQYEAANILLLTPMGSKSHKNFFMGIVKIMASRGHQVTVVSTHKNSKEIKNVRDVVLKTDSAETFVRDVFDNKEKVVYDLLINGPSICSQGLLSPEIAALKKEKFDLVLMSLFFSECYFSLIHLYKVPFIWLSPAGLFGPLTLNSGNLNFPAVVPNKLLTQMHPMSFTERLISTGLDSMLIGSYELYTLTETERICREKGACPPDMPPISEFFPNASLTILNSIETLEIPPRPYMGNTIFAGGLHCEASKPLPKDLESWFQGSGKEGVIFFSLGSAVTPSDMPEKYRLILKKVFGSLKQRVLWKWDEDSMPDLPPNVKLGKWLPQQDILGHPKTKMFITHGGFLSTLEATYHACPILGIPVFADQHANIAEAYKEGWSEMLLWEDLSEESLRKKINIVLKDESLRENIQIRAKLMNDVDMKPKDRVTYWIEYVLRHNGALHLRSPMTAMPFYKMYNMDVWAAVVSVLLLILYLIWTLLKCIFRCIFCRKSSPKPQPTQKKKKKA